MKERTIPGFLKICSIFILSACLFFAADAKTKTSNDLEQQFPTDVESLGLSDPSSSKDTKEKNTADKKNTGYGKDKKTELSPSMSALIL